MTVPPEDLEEMREEQAAAGKKPMYDGRSRNLGLERSDKTVLRLATPLEGETVVNDLIRGEITFNNSELDDLILLRSDGTPHTISVMLSMISIRCNHSNPRRGSC